MLFVLFLGHPEVTQVSLDTRMFRKIVRLNCGDIFVPALPFRAFSESSSFVVNGILRLSDGIGYILIALLFINKSTNDRGLVSRQCSSSSHFVVVACKERDSALIVLTYYYLVYTTID